MMQFSSARVVEQTDEFCCVENFYFLFFGALIAASGFILTGQP